MQKKLKLAVAGVCLTAIPAIVIYKKRSKLIRKKVTLPQGFIVTAHTGCENTAANSLNSIEMAHRCGADCVEFDLNFNKDGVPVLSHDRPKGGEVLLEEAFWTLQGYDKLKVNVDLKSTEDLKSVKALAEKYGMLERIFYTGVRERDVPDVISQTPDVPYYLNVEVDAFLKNNREYLLSLVSNVKNAGAVGINMRYSGCTKELADVFHENNLLVSLWTVNEERNMCKCLDMAPDNITTKRPSSLRVLLTNKTN